MIKRLIILSLIFGMMSCSDELDPSVANTLFGMTALKYEYIIVLLSMIGGYTLIIGGVILMLLGLSGNVEWIVEAASVQSKLVNASPGLVMILVGALLVWKSRMDVKVKRGDNEKQD